MKKVTLNVFCFLLVLGFAGSVQAQRSDVDIATEESARRQAHKIELDRRLTEAQAAEKKG